MRGFTHIFANALIGNAAIHKTPIFAASPGVVPTAPGPGDVFKQGAACTFSWTADSSGQWKEMNVQLMSGSNLAMVPVTTVASLDGTNAANTTYSYPCPAVTPNSAIYFYQLSTPAAPTDLTWTTRFTIAGTDGSTTPPADNTQPNGQVIPWGVRALVNEADVVAPPSYLAPQGAHPSSSSSPASAAAGSSSTSSSSGAAAATTTSSSFSSSSSTGSSSSAASTSDIPGAKVGNGGKSTWKNAVLGSLAMGVARGSRARTHAVPPGAGVRNGAECARTNVVLGSLAMGLAVFVFAMM